MGQEILGINELIEAIKITDLGLIRDAAKLMEKQARQGNNIMAEMFR